MVIFFLILSIFTLNGLAQSNLSIVEAQSQYAIENITVSNGLYNNYIFDVLQDHLGFLWLASDIGLQKYDGYTFTLYTPDTSDVISRKALRLYEDKNNTLWVQMEEGLIRYRRELDDFVKFDFVNSRNDTIPYKVTAMAEDLDSTMWVWIQDKGLYKVDFENQTFIPNSKVNKWFRDIKLPRILKEGNRKGIYEIWIKFPKDQYGNRLAYKFAVKRKDGTLEIEPNPNHDSPGGWGNRFLTLLGDTLILPIATFNSNTKIVQKNVKVVQKSALKPTYVKFRFNIDKLENPLLLGDEIQILAGKLPLTWGDNIEVNSIIFDLENKLWIGLGYLGLVQFNLETGDFNIFFENKLIPGTISSYWNSTALRDQDGSLWFGNFHGLSKYSPDNNSFENYFIDPLDHLRDVNRVFRMTTDGQGNIWTISQNVKGIGYFNKIKKEYSYYTKGVNNWISSVTTDQSGIIWLSSWYRGISKLDPRAKKFSTFSIKKNKKDILDGKRIIAVYEDKAGEIWIGGEVGGLYRYNRETGKISFYKINEGNFESWLENYIFDIFQDSKGNFWIGTFGGLCHFNSRTGSFKHIQQPRNTTYGLGRIAIIHEDRHGKLWVVTRNGLLVQFEPDTYKTESYPLHYVLKVSDPSLVEDPRGFFWIGSSSVEEQGEGGVSRFDLNKKRLSFVKQLEKFNITSLCLDDGILWCATKGEGLIRYDTKTDKKSFIRANDGLLSNSIMGLEQDNSGNLWISTPRGLSKYNPKTGTFNHYFKEDGFFTNEFTSLAHYKSKNGEMIFGSYHGVVTFYPDSIKTSKYMPPIVLTDLKIQNESVGVGKSSPLKKSISVSDEIKLAHDQNDITITFASLDYKHPERIKYSFYLENFEEDWRKPGLERTAYYTNLDPGEYIFKVKGTNSDGVWNEAGTYLKIIILPPWWATWWAYTIYGCFVFGLLYGFRRYELNRQNLKHSWELERVETEKYQEIDRMKSRFFANISHEFRTPLTLIKGPIQQMLFEDFSEKIKKQFKMVLRNTNRLMQLINQLLDLSKLDSGEMVLKASPEDIVPLVNGLTQSFESLAKQKNIKLQFQSSENEIIVYIDRDKFEKIIINLLSNALKFTPEGGNVSVNINLPTPQSPPERGSKGSGQDSNFLEITVLNTGPGILPEQIDKIFDRFYQVDASSVRKYEGTGIGLSLTKELVELHQGKIKVESEPEKETTFTIYLPLGKNHLQSEEIVETSKEVLSDMKIDPDLIESAISSKSKTEAATQPVKDSSTLLIVEDNADMRSYIREGLVTNYKIIEAGNGEEGIQQSLEYSPDVIISDVMMPKMDGFQFCAEIKKDERTSHIPVILLTAKASGESRIEGLETGADDYLTKPFDNLELQVRIKNLIEQRRKLQEKFRKEFIIRPRDITVTSIDEQFVQKAIDAVEKNISDPNFNTTVMAKEMGTSRTLLNTKLKALTGLPTGEFIRTLRLKRAAQLLQQGHGNVTQVAYDVGFQNLSYFAKAFREQFGQSPSHYTPKSFKNPKN